MQVQDCPAVSQLNRRSRGSRVISQFFVCLFTESVKVLTQSCFPASAVLVHSCHTPSPSPLQQASLRQHFKHPAREKIVCVGGLGGGGGGEGVVGGGG